MKKRISALVLAMLFVLSALIGCGQSTKADDTTAPADTNASTEAKESESQTAEETASGTSVEAADVKIGVITTLVKNDGGWCQAQYEGITGAMENVGLDTETQLLFLENIAEEQSSVQAAVDQLVNEGCQIIFGASTGYAPILSELALSYPDVYFAQVGDKVENIIGYQIRDYQAMYLCGYLMGLMSDSDELGYSAGMSEASVRRGINAFALGAKAANPNATVTVMWANSWYDIAAETECANTLINMGIKYMGINASSPAIPEACEKAGAFCTGYHMDMKDRAPKAVTTSFEWNWAPIITDIIEQYMAGTLSTDTYYFWGADKDCARISDINMDIVPQEVADKVLEMKDKIISGEIEVYDGGEEGLKDNKGNVLVAPGEIMSDEDIMSQMFLVENVKGEW